MIKLVAVDLDGTLLDENHQLNDRTAQAIKKIQKQGITFMVATGRNYKSVLPLFKEKGIVCDYLLLNGALISDYHGNPILQIPFSIDAAEKAISVLEKSELPYHINTEKGIITTNAEKCRMMFIKHMKRHGMSDEEIDEMMRTSSFGRYDREVKDTSAYLKENPVIYKMEAFGDEEKKITDTFSELNKIEELAITNSVADNIEVTVKQAQKGIALKELCKMKQIKEEEVVVIGDSLNDLSMMKEFKNSVAMKNAIDIIKQSASYITENNYDFGVSLVLEDLVRDSEKKRFSFPVK